MTAVTDVLVERQGPITYVKLHNPERLNAVTASMMNHAADAVLDAARDARVIVLTGSGRAFSAGADLAPGGAGETDPKRTVDGANRLTRAIRGVPVPVVAAVNGPAAGGSCSFAIAADVSLIRESAYLYFSWTRNGLMPDAGAHALLAAAIGHVRASQVVMLAERITAPVAVQWGLIGQLVPDDEFDAEVARVAGRLANGATAAYAQVKRAFNACAVPGLEEILDIEREGQAALFETVDVKEGFAAFQERRKPQFVGR